jgi:hypothetical protein
MKIIIGLRKSIPEGGKVDRFDAVISGTNNYDIVKNKILRIIRSNPVGNYEGLDDPMYDFCVLDDNKNKKMTNSVELLGETVGIIDDKTLIKFDLNDDGNIVITEVGDDIVNENLPQDSTVKQLKSIRKSTKKVTIDDEQKKISPYAENPIDNGVESYQQYQKRNVKKYHLNTVKSFEDFTNEGKISQFILRSIYNSLIILEKILTKLKIKEYPTLKFKDKKMSSEFYNELSKLLDYSLFDSWKHYISSKKFNRDAYKTSFSELIKSRSGVDLYEVSSSLLSKLNNIDNFIISDNETTSEKQLLRIEKYKDLVRKVIGFTKRTDDEIGEFQESIDKLIDSIKLLDDVVTNKREIDNNLDSIDAKKELNYILDKVSKYGMESLTQKEQDDLEYYSK